MTKLKKTCPKRGSWCSFRLVDEHGKATPYAGLDYTLHDRMGMTYSGTLDSEGYARLESFYMGPLVLDLSMPYQGGVDPWYDILKERDAFKLPLTALQVAAEQSPSGPRINGRTYLARKVAEQEQAAFFQVEVRDFAKPGEVAHLPEADTALNSRPSPYLKEACTHSNTQPGIALKANQHNVLEVKALRALSPLFSRDKAFCALNAYHLSMMAVLSYAPFHRERKPEEAPTPPPYSVPGCIGSVLQSQLGHMIPPTQFKQSGPFHLLSEEVPYSKRLEIMPYNPERYAKEAKADWKYPEQVHFLHHKKTETQAFITHNDKVVLISVRGSQELADFLRDADARQVPHVDGQGKIHRGFHDAFLVARTFVERYMDAFYRKGQTIIVSGHSLGGAIALLLTEWLQREYSDDIQLYTYGSPRTGNRTFVEAAQSLPHHRLVNHNDPIPAVPATWMDAEWRMALPGSVILIAGIGNPLVGALLLLGGLLNLRGDPYQHHGEQRHFMPRKAGLTAASSVLWQPGCAAIEELTCAKFAGAIELKGDMPARQSFGKQMLSMGEHFNDPGYANAALATVLRWYASVSQRDGALFTDTERKQLGLQIDLVQTEVEQIPALTYTQFRHNLRQRTDLRFDRLTELQLRSLFQDSQQQLNALRTQQLQELSRAQKRLKAQSERTLGWQDVFGDVADSPALRQLLNTWLALDANKAAAGLAKVTPKNTERAYA
jgi:hypothetical protein